MGNRKETEVVGGHGTGRRKKKKDGGNSAATRVVTSRIREVEVG